ncbi:MAG: deoxyguanosinetriphosphate triphosphohydrolase family protein [Bacilli bacterium]
MLEEVKKNMSLRNSLLSSYAVKDEDAICFKEVKDEDIRSPFFRDIDRIIYSLSYTRYADKTQVFSLSENDNISRRMTHVQMVSKVARTIGRALNLNEDLIEAAALGHDLGHVPFGHAGEKILNKISLECGEGYFNHNVQSVRTLMTLENNGKGRNVTLQVLDGILCHNGELELKEYRPVKKTKEKFLEEYESTYHNASVIKTLVPMSLEGCVVRISDIIAYIGKDIEDAVMLGVIDIKDIPKDITDVLGVGNKNTINTLILDIIKNSLGKDYLAMSDEVFEALIKLKKYNYEHIYDKANTKDMLNNYDKMFRVVFNKCLEDVKKKNINSSIYKIYLDNMCEEYLNKTTDERKVIDYIAGMTDDFLISQYELFSN